MSAILAFDVGSTHVKTTLFESESLEILAWHVHEYELIVQGECVENRPADWWDGMRAGVARVLLQAGMTAQSVEALSFCAQMQGLVLVDEQGEALRNSMSYLDGRAKEIFDREMRRGWLRVEGLNARRILSSLWVTNGAAASCKDPLWKLHWVKENQPELYARAHKWVDVKDYLVARCTGVIRTTADSAHLTFLRRFSAADVRYDEKLCQIFGVNPELLPEVIDGTEIVGGLQAQAAEQLGLRQGTPVVAGGGDVGCVALGAGCVDPGSAHLYLGTSAWIGVTTQRKLLDISHFMASLRTSVSGVNQYTGELQTAGICLKWALGALLDERGEFSDLDRLVGQSPAGAQGALFAPWLLGSRSPFEDATARGAFLNIGLHHKKADLARAVFEGVAHHLRWIADAADSKLVVPRSLRLVGGGGNSETWAQILADVTSKQIELPHHPQHAGVRGAAMLASVALGKASLQETGQKVVTQRTVEPRAVVLPMYDRQHQHFRQMYRRNRKLFARMQRVEREPVLSSEQEWMSAES